MLLSGMQRVLHAGRLGGALPISVTWNKAHLHFNAQVCASPLLEFEQGRLLLLLDSGLPALRVQGLYTRILQKLVDFSDFRRPLALAYRHKQALAGTGCGDKKSGVALGGIVPETPPLLVV